MNKMNLFVDELAVLALRALMPVHVICAALQALQWIKASPPALPPSLPPCFSIAASNPVSISMLRSLHFSLLLSLFPFPPPILPPSDCG